MQLLQVDRTLLEEDPTLLEDNLNAVAGSELTILLLLLIVPIDDVVIDCSYRCCC